VSAPHAAHPTLWPLRFISVEAASGVVLLVSAAIALVWDNSPLGASYQALWHLEVCCRRLPQLPAHDLHFWVNDGLMTLFFLVVGLEIRREIHDGGLSDPRVATLPVVAAIGGIVAPALFYLVLNADSQAARGWAIPTATDIAFAVGILSLAGKGIPAAVRTLLLTLAIVDDIAAILVIAFFYSSGIAPYGLLIVAAGVLIVLGMQRLRIALAWAYVVPGAVVWFGMLCAGVHPTLAGVLLGLLTPAACGADGSSALARLEARLHPWAAFGIMPLFALANAGVSLQGLHLNGPLPLGIAIGIAGGLLLGKPLGIVLACHAAVRLRWCSLPARMQWPHTVMLGFLGGIGFTMSIFIANLAFGDATLLAAAKFAVLVASGTAAAIALLLGRLHARAPRPH
jgi:Na+:H+ antiporter, NhaA family